jgi:hypothetical protein
MPEIHFDQEIASEAGNGILTLWDLANPQATVEAAKELYGSNAATAAAWCALTAHFDGRDEDYRFWCTVFSRLGSDTEH